MLSLTSSFSLLERQGATRLALAFSRLPALPVLLSLIRSWPWSCKLVCTGLPEGHQSILGAMRILSPPQAVREGIDGVVVIDGLNFATVMRGLEPLARTGAIVLPASADWVVPKDLRKMSPMETAWATRADANYVSRSALQGHYLEFGTFWGRSFFPAYFRLRHWLKGNFFAFDSFEGLSSPRRLETDFTGGDFREGSYCANAASFKALAKYVGMDTNRLVVVSGFYEQTLRAVDPARYGLAPGSVSVCVIDCDLFEPTRLVLEFVLPLLEPGALIYFDDWRLCRASPDVGERAAALEWLRQHPDVELVELHRDHWQHQWFIFHRRSELGAIADELDKH